MSLVKAILAALIKGNPQDVLFKAIPESMSNANDKAASVEYRDAMDEKVAAMYRAWEGREDHERSQSSAMKSLTSHPKQAQSFLM